MIHLDVLLKNTRIVDVFRLRVFSGWVGIRGDRFIYVEEGNPPENLIAAQVRDLQGAVLAPGLIDSHMHIESSLLTPRRFVEAALPHGTTAVLADAHEVANVAGEAGVGWMIAAGNLTAMRIYHAIPSCVPATAPEIETTTQVFGAQEVLRLAPLPRVIALGEVMDYRGLLGLSQRLPPMLAAARQAGLRLEGHISTLEGMELSEYLSHGIASSHSLTHPAKMYAELSKGVAVMLQTKSLTADNMAAVNALPDRSGVLLVTDDIEPSLLRRGHLSLMVQLAVENGLPALEALASASLRPARYLGLRDLGAIAPGYLADFLVLDDLAHFPPRQVWVGGRLTALEGSVLPQPLPDAPPLPEFPPLPGPLRREDFRVLPAGSEGSGWIANAVRLDGALTSLTSLDQVPLRVRDGYACLAEGDDLALVGVFARGGTSRGAASRAVGIMKGIGVLTGAAATSMAHDSHNLLVVGRNVNDMLLAANAVHAMGGGVAVVGGAHGGAHGGAYGSAYGGGTSSSAVIAALKLPVFSLISDEPVDQVAEGMQEVEKALDTIGFRHKRPFLLLSLLSLSVSPYFKFSDKGVVDTEKRAILPPVFAP